MLSMYVSSENGNIPQRCQVLDWMGSTGALIQSEPFKSAERLQF